jgi:hypothetical protein
MHALYIQLFRIAIRFRNKYVDLHYEFYFINKDLFL